jgi:hypothetical protein
VSDKTRRALTSYRSGKHSVRAYVRARIHLHDPVQHPVRGRLADLRRAAFDMRHGPPQPAPLIVAPAVGQNDEACVQLGARAEAAEVGAVVGDEREALIDGERDQLVVR